MGERRQELTLEQIYQAYGSRFDLEHFFRFGKQKLLLVDFQTPEVEREENWWQLAHIAYAQLWMARHVAHALPRPWERNLPAMRQRLISPTLVQRDFGTHYSPVGDTGSTAQTPRYFPGRRTGMKLPKRLRQSVVVKGRDKPPKQPDFGSIAQLLRFVLNSTHIEFSWALSKVQSANATRRAILGGPTYDVRELFMDEIDEAYQGGGSAIAGYLKLAEQRLACQRCYC